MRLVEHRTRRKSYGCPTRFSLGSVEKENTSKPPCTPIAQRGVFVGRYMTCDARMRVRGTDSLLPPTPQNLDAERCVLGAVILDNAALNVAVAAIRAEDFFLPENQSIFRRMVQLAGKSVPIDFVSLHEEFSRTGDLEKVGGAAYISQLPDGLPRVNNVAHYARIVRQKSVLRQLAHAAEEIREEALNFRGDDADVILTR